VHRFTEQQAFSLERGRLRSDMGEDPPDEPRGDRPACAREEAHAEPDADLVEVEVEGMLGSFCRGLLQSGGACPADAEGRGNSGECRPAALLDVGVLQPRIDLFQFDHVRRGIGVFAELLRAHWGKNRHDGDGGTLLRHSLRGTFQCPPAPSESDDHGGEAAGKSAQQEMRERPGSQD
jgi:hypothetical protein